MKTAGLFERVDERLEVLHPSGLNTKVDDEPAGAVLLRLETRQSNVLGERGLELRKQIRPGERTEVDDGVGFLGGSRHIVQFLGVDLRPDAARFFAQTLRLRFSLLRA